MKMVDVDGTKADDLSLFDGGTPEAVNAEGETKSYDDLKEIRKSLEDLYNQLEED